MVFSVILRLRLIAQGTWKDSTSNLEKHNRMSLEHGALTQESGSDPSSLSRSELHQSKMVSHTVRCLLSCVV